MTSMSYKAVSACEKNGVKCALISHNGVVVWEKTDGTRYSWAEIMEMSHYIAPQKPKPKTVSPREICIHAVDLKTLEWSQDKAAQKYVTWAMLRDLTLDDCRRVFGLGGGN